LPLPHGGEGSGKVVDVCFHGRVSYRGSLDKKRDSQDGARNGRAAARMASTASKWRNVP
jgi:hypothetical protein